VRKIHFNVRTPVGWFLYFTNRYRKDVALSDVATLLSAIGGGAVTALFGKGDGTGAGLFLSYGSGLAFGFFAYFIVLVGLVFLSKDEFTFAYLIDGRRKDPQAPFGYGPGAQSPVRSFDLEPRTPPLASTVLQFPLAVPTGAGQGPVDSQRAALVSALDDARLAVLQQFNATTDEGERGRLDDAERHLDAQRDRIDAAAIRADLTSQEVQRAVATLTTATQNIQTEAQNIKDAATALSTAAKIVGWVAQAISILAPLA
jgi:hypothetical protein